MLDIYDGYLWEPKDGGPISFDLMKGVLANFADDFVGLAECGGISPDYEAFLKTRYWFIVANRVKELAGGKCSMCGSRKNLQAHHKTYEHHWQEHLYLDDLTCLCDRCHSKFHNKLPKWGASR